MFKKTKAAALGAAGVALLVGSGSTFAMWNQEARLAQDVLDLGTLAITADELTWTDVSDVIAEGGLLTRNAEAGTPIGNQADFETFVLTPGDRVVGVGDIDMVLHGETLRAVLSEEGEAFVLYDGARIAPGWVVVDVVFTDLAGNVVTNLEFGVDDVAAPTDLRVEVRLDFPEGPLRAGELEQGRQLHLSDLTVHLTQIL